MHEALDDLVRELDGRLEELGRHLTSRRVRLRRQMAAAGLWRCRALLQGMVALREAGRTDVLGVLGRSLFETHLVSLYVLKGRDLDDDAVLHELAADHFKWQKRMVKTAKLPERVAANVEEWEGILRKLEVEPRKLNYERIAEELGPLLEKVEGAEADVAGMYHILYRGESLYSAHAGQGALLRYLQWDDREEADSLITNPGPPFPGQTRIAALLTTHLAIRVLKAFSVIVEPPLSDVFERIAALREPGEAEDEPAGQGVAADIPEDAEPAP